MFWEKSNIENDKLDEVGKLLLKSISLDEQEIEKIVNAPFLQSRLRTKIMKESLKRNEIVDSWVAIWSIARYAVPAMVFVAIVAIGSFWMLEIHAQEVTNVNFSSASPPPKDLTATSVTACSISSKSECVVSSNDVLSIVFQSPTMEIKNGSSK